jgi:hypothetical protein
MIYRHCERNEEDKNKPVSQEEFNEYHWKCSGDGDNGKCDCPCHKQENLKKN